MKKLLIALLCLLFAGLCACEPTTSEKETTTQKTNTEITATDTTKVSIPTFTIKTNPEDPYSYEVDRYLDIYNEIINGDSQFMPPYYYFLYDIDDNGTKELLLGFEWEGKMYLESVHVIKDGIAVRQEALPKWMAGLPPSLLFMNGTIRGAAGGDNNLSYGYYRFEAGELKWKISLEYESGEYFLRYPDNLTKFIPTTKEEYERLKKEMEGDGQLVELDWKPLAEYGR